MNTLRGLNGPSNQLQVQITSRVLVPSNRHHQGSSYHRGNPQQTLLGLKYTNVRTLSNGTNGIEPFCPEYYPIYQPTYPDPTVQTVNQPTQSFTSTTSSLPGTTNLGGSTSGPTQPASGAVNSGANASFTPSSTSQNCMYPTEEEHYATQIYQQGAGYPYIATTTQGYYPVYSYDGSTPGASYHYQTSL